MIGSFTCPFPGRAALDSIVRSWGVKCKIISCEKAWTVFRFMNNEDRLHVFQEGPYMTYGKHLMLKFVDNGIMLTDGLFMKVPKWVLLPDVPFSIWRESGLSKIASKVGRPLFTDQVTKERFKMNYTRCLVEVDVERKPVLEVGVQMSGGMRYTQKVTYENFPNYCCESKYFGHNCFKCPKFLGDDKQKEAAKEVASTIGKSKATKPHVRANSTTKGGLSRTSASLPKSCVPPQKVSVPPLPKSSSLLATNPFGVSRNVGDSSGGSNDGAQGTPLGNDMEEQGSDWYQVGKNYGGARG